MKISFAGLSSLLFCLLFTALGHAQYATYPVDTKAENISHEEFVQAFTPLVGKKWQANGQFEDGPDFEQEVEFSWSLEKNAVIANSSGFVDKRQSQTGQRNHGIRLYNSTEEKISFVEYDIFGGVSEGRIELKGQDIYYHYVYGNSNMIDTWEYVDENHYTFTIAGAQEGDEYMEIFLSTSFKAESGLEEVMIPTDMELPYRNIPDAPETYNACTVAARMVDGLGFRYYWATEGLRQVDLAYKTSADARTSAETLDHIHGLVYVVHNAVMEVPNIRGGEREELTYAEKRAQTLQLLKATSDKLRESKPEDMERFNIIFQRGDQRTEYPFWNNLNGPLADAIWHVGQVVAFRRASGNPFNSNVSVLRGKVRE